MLRLCKWLFMFWWVRPIVFFANAVSTITNIPGYTTPIGNRALAVKKFSWNNGNYVAGGAAGSMKIFAQGFGLRGFDASIACLSAGGNYIVQIQVAQPGAQSAIVRLYVATTGAEVANAAALTADFAMIGMIGG